MATNERIGIDIVANDKASPAINKVEKELDQLTKSVETAGKLIGAYLTVETAKATWEFAKLGAKAKDTENAFATLTRNMGVNGDKLVNSLKKASRGMIDDTDLMAESSKALMIMGDTIANDLPKLMEIARASAMATGQDVGDVFNNLVTGVIRQSDRMLASAGITLDTTKIYKDYAMSLGKTAEQLTETEKQQAVLNEVMNKGKDIVKNLDNNQKSLNETYLATQTTFNNLVEEMQKILATKFQPIVENANTAMVRFGTLIQLISDPKNKEAWGNVFKAYGESLKDFSKALFYDRTILRLIFPSKEQIEKEATDLGTNLTNAYAGQQVWGGMDAIVQERRQKEFDAVRKAEEDKANLIFQSQQAILAGTAGFFGNMASVAQAGGDQFFNVYKTFAIAEGIISTIGATLGAFDSGNKLGGPALGALWAAGAAAAGIAKVAQIASTNPGSGSAGSSISATPTPSATPVASPSSSSTGTPLIGSNSPVPVSNGGGVGGVINITLQNPVFMSAGDFKSAVNDIFNTASSMGYDVPKLDSIKVVQ